jgi:hypothetical protein
MMDLLIFLPWLIAFVLGFILSFCDMISKLESSKYKILFTGWGVGLYAVNGLIAIFLLGILLHFEVTAMNVLMLSIIVGFSSTILMRSRLLSTETNLTIGLDFSQQNMEKLFVQRMKEKSSRTEEIRSRKLYLRLVKYNLRELKEYAMAVIFSKIKDEVKREEKVQYVEKLMNDSSTDSVKKMILSTIIVVEGGHYYAWKVIKGKV